jgi:hypothetical protein
MVGPDWCCTRSITSTARSIQTAWIPTTTQSRYPSTKARARPGNTDVGRINVSADDRDAQPAHKMATGRRLLEVAISTSPDVCWLTEGLDQVPADFPRDRQLYLLGIAKARWAQPKRLDEALHAATEALGTSPGLGSPRGRERLREFASQLTARAGHEGLPRSRPRGETKSSNPNPTGIEPGNKFGKALRQPVTQPTVMSVSNRIPCDPVLSRTVCTRRSGCRRSRLL